MNLDFMNGEIANSSYMYKLIRAQAATFKEPNYLNPIDFLVNPYTFS